MSSISNTAKKTRHGKYSKYSREVLAVIFVLVFMAYIIIYPEKSGDFVIKALNLCYLVIIPSLFPFLIISRLFFESPLFSFIGRILDKPAKILFNIRGEYTNAFLLGSIAGFPIGAKSVKDIYYANKHTKNEAERTLAFCNNCSAPFVISAAGIVVFGSANIGLLLFAVQFISAIITGIIIKFLFKPKEPDFIFNYNKNAKNTNIDIQEETRGLPSAVTEAVTGMLNICGIIIFFSVVINMLLHLLGEISFVFTGDVIKIAASGILEISSGVYSLVNINLPASQKLILMSAILAWSGLSVHFQIIYVLKDTGLSLKPYFTGKLIHVIIASVIIKILFGFNGIAKMCQSSYSPIAIMGDQQSYTASLIVIAIVSGVTAVVVIFTALGYWIYERSHKTAG